VSGRSGKDLLYIDDRLENVETGERRGWQVIHHQNAQTTNRRVEEIVGQGRSGT